MLENKESAYLSHGCDVVEPLQKQHGGKGVVEMDDYEELSEGDDDVEVQEEDEEAGRVFSIGEFVWGKIKNHPWWPGQIYDASHASELALKHKPKDKEFYLVAYFGDGTFSWCSCAQLKSFDKDFEPLSQQCGLKSFLFAVEDALSVIGEVMALGMSCSCVRRNGQAECAWPVAENAGIRKGVSVPMVGVDRFAASVFETVGIVASIKNAARSVFMENRLELTLLNSQLLAFYRSKGYRELPKYHFPVYIDGLEDVNKSDGADISADGGDGQPFSANPLEKGCVLTKVKAETIKEETGTDVKNEKDGKEATPGKQGKKRKKLVDKIDPPGRARRPEADRIDDNNRRDNVKADAAIMSKGRKRAATASVMKDKSREKKRDTVHTDSPTPIASVKQARFEPVILKVHTDSQVGEWVGKAAKLTESPPIRRQCNIIFEKEPDQSCWVNEEALSLRSDETIKQGQEDSGADLMATKIFPGMKPATFTLHERPFGSKLDVFSLNKLSNKDTHYDEDDDNGRPLSAILFLTFSPDVSLPSKADLLAKYSQFGSLNEEETIVLPDSLCAQVVFIKQTEGEQAFNHVVKMNSAESGLQYRIRYIPRDANFRKLHENPLSISYLKQKLDTLISKLGDAEGDSLSNDLKNELHSEMANLLDKLS